MLPLKAAEARDVLEIVETRHPKGSTIILSQFSLAGWHTKIGESALVDAILDKIVHDSYEIFIDWQGLYAQTQGLEKVVLTEERPATAPLLACLCNSLQVDQGCVMLDRFRRRVDHSREIPRHCINSSPSSFESFRKMRVF